MSWRNAAPLQFSLALLVSILASKLSEAVECRDLLRGMLTLHFLHEVNSSNVSVCVVFTSVLGGDCTNHVVTAL